MKFKLLAITTGRKPELNKIAQDRFIEKEKIINHKLMKKIEKGLEKGLR